MFKIASVCDSGKVLLDGHHMACDSEFVVGSAAAAREQSTDSNGTLNT